MDTDTIFHTSYFHGTIFSRMVQDLLGQPLHVGMRHFPSLYNNPCRSRLLTSLMSSVVRIYSNFSLLLVPSECTIIIIGLIIDSLVLYICLLVLHH